MSSVITKLLKLSNQFLDFVHTCKSLSKNKFLPPIIILEIDLSTSDCETLLLILSDKIFKLLSTLWTLLLIVVISALV